MKPGISVEEQWRRLIEEGKTPDGRKRLASFYAVFPSTSRCRICNLPFAGPMGRFMHFLGRHPSSFNPHLCNACDSFARANPGGIEIRLSMLFADVRGSTGLAEHMKTREYSNLIDRFYATATDVLSRFNAIIDKLAGDQVSGYFVPGFVGQGHARAAVGAARQLRQATGHGEPTGPWIPLGVGVHAGDAFIGAVGSQGGLTDVAALGDAVNIAARLAASAGAGEILISQETCREAGLEPGGLEQRVLVLRGRSGQITAYVV